MLNCELTPSFWRNDAFIHLRKQIDTSFAAHLTPASNSESVSFQALVRQLYNDNLSGLRYAKNKGGTGHGLAAQALFAESLGRVPSGGIGMGLTIHLDMVAPIVDQQGSAHQIEEYLLPALRGDIIFSHAVSEPHAGSDISNIQTTAVKDGDGWRIDGCKSMIALASLADVHFVVARIPGHKPPFNKINFLIPAATTGVKVSSVTPTLGNNDCPIANITFDNVWVADSNRLGTAGMGMIHQMQQFSQERILSSLRANEVARMCLTHAEHLLNKLNNLNPLNNLNNRHNKPNPSTASYVNSLNNLYTLKAELNASKAITYKAMGTWIDNGNYHTLSCSSKLLSSRLVRQASILALTVSKALGENTDAQLVHYFNDARLYSISTGSDEMMLKSIAASEKY
ncbi:acyl-CoA dehydrogenase family protein [Saccharophagus degradans]|uniref:Acyl-CoA dehydrogenase family protein n=1 Tax=Saccharophagus degradans TaxID=86304 RepID=A0AAW7X7Z9_9GAMM|nr:acyl-CoA dehydrogenase family protein [Saccharophagus degradans]MDO6423831.1 acyl-CoA dehydrogenase family protein [Saccharophagus degradans]MDO6607911.1 acyl-CoA dehydrogenase family protein [Saccharophagus degradans]